MINRTRFPLESVVNVKYIVKVNHTVKCEITWLLNDKHDEIPSRICHECQFYSQSEKNKCNVYDNIRSYKKIYDKTICKK